MRAERLLLVDTLRSTLELADAFGTLQTHHKYDPFATAASGTTSTNGAQFLTQTTDRANCLRWE
jgi:hypothetical protein